MVKSYLLAVREIVIFGFGLGIVDCHQLEGSLHCCTYSRICAGT